MAPCTSRSIPLAFLIAVLSCCFSCGGRPAQTPPGAKKVEPTRLPAPSKEVPLDVYFVGVNGEAIVVDYGDTEIVIDGGKGDTLLRFLVRQGLVNDGTIELLILTHSDTDHFVGLHSIVSSKKFEILEYWDPGYDRGFAWTSPGKYRKFVSAMEETSAFLKRPLEDFHQPVSQGASDEDALAFQVGDTLKLHLIHTNKAPQTSRSPFWTAGMGGYEGYKINNSSIVVRLDFTDLRSDRTHRFLFTGDINGRSNRRSQESSEVEALLIEQAGQSLCADVMSVPHHGSTTSSTPRFLQAVCGLQWAVVSRHNILGMGPPSKRILKAVSETLPNPNRLLMTGVKQKRDDGKDSYASARCRVKHGTLSCAGTAYDPSPPHL